MAVFAACEPAEQNLGTPDISISVEEMTFATEGGDQELDAQALEAHSGDDLGGDPPAEGQAREIDGIHLCSSGVDLEQAADQQREDAPGSESDDGILSQCDKCVLLHDVFLL